ncbi:hypothetical protein Syun_029375 [Stephania yunnanensis]|uniref:Brf1 TBP-binding domain-containing protein n=1 Tax=Stephania yunnanensis TaxID=152371 RepID=A0AAP0E5I5_9MAGN
MEVDGYLHNEEEKRYKKIIREYMNKEYLEEQAAKEAATSLPKEAYLADFEHGSKELFAPQNQIESPGSRQLESIDTHDQEVDENNFTQPCSDEALDNMATGESESLF